MYRKFLIMLLISFLIMYAVMFFNVDKLDHVYLSATRFYMTILMVSPMAILMLVLMPGMYDKKKYNAYIFITGITTFVLALTFLRAQTFVGDEQYIKAMIPHHSSAIMVSQKAALKDPELKQLSQEIIKAQEKEIAEMKAILTRVENEH